MPSRIFVNSENSWQVGEGILLSKEHNHYLQKVLRLREQSTIEIVNKLTNQVFLAELTEKLTTAKLLSDITPTKHSGTLNLIFAYCKSTKNETIIEKCTELGVDNFIIYQAKHSIAKIGNNKTERLEKIAEAAACQSKRNTIPSITIADDLKKLTEAIDRFSEKNSMSFIASLEHDRQNPPKDINPNYQINLAVGPEGDFTEEEYLLFKQLGFQAINLGTNILRAETAAIATTSYFSLLRI